MSAVYIPLTVVMKSFYEMLKMYDGDEGITLTQAKRIFMNDDIFKHPYFWSGFILTSANKEFDT